MHSKQICTPPPSLHTNETNAKMSTQIVQTVFAVNLVALSRYALSVPHENIHGTAESEKRGLPDVKTSKVPRHVKKTFLSGIFQAVNGLAGLSCTHQPLAFRSLCQRQIPACPAAPRLPPASRGGTESCVTINSKKESIPLAERVQNLVDDNAEDSKCRELPLHRA